MNRFTFGLITYTIFVVCSPLDAGDWNTTCAAREASRSVSQRDQAFEIIDDFEKNKTRFHKDTIDLLGQTTEGGRLIVFRASDKDYIVFDLWLFGEMGKTQTIYWTDEKLNIRIVKRTDYSYDKPFYVEGYQIKETTEFYSLVNGSFKIYNVHREEINHSDSAHVGERISDLFNEVTKSLELSR